MKLILLGTGGYYANEVRHTACLTLPEIGVVLDAGSGLFRLAEYRATDRLDIFLTHAHLDHVLGLTYLLDVLPEAVQRETVVHGDAVKLDAIRTHLFSEPIFPVLPAFRFEPLSGECAVGGGGKLTHFPLAHPGGSIGYRIDWPDRSLAYVTDTTATPDAPYLEKIRGVSVLVHEAYFGDAMEAKAELTGHSCLSTVARLAAAAEVGLLVLVHVDPRPRSDAEFDLKAAQKIFPSTLLGVDRMEIEF
ncbi:MAG: MBL fold metallo-hydrolase [Pirellulales bacterium]